MLQNAFVFKQATTNRIGNGYVPEFVGMHKSGNHLLAKMLPICCLVYLNISFESVSRVAQYTKSTNPLYGSPSSRSWCNRCGHVANSKMEIQNKRKKEN